MKIIQFIVLFKIILGGIVVGMFFDSYRIIRWKLRIGKIATFFCDIVFSFLASLIVIKFAFEANNLEIRFYLFLAILIGLLIYFSLFSVYIKKIVNFFVLLIYKIYKQFKNMVLLFFGVAKRLLVGMMWLPYSVLRWFALLLFRILEATLYRTWHRTKRL